ncbi:hypothetical protein FCJ61_09245 [Burkholderia metallica]|uniref:hypothetical protein n=1 Tax=Burkholderia TaxID=32008 RepID=UPI00157A3933|nr:MULTISPECIES: hypothetical protein [Burkholderia]NTZ83173.1 hypothetical protein [Burkholderia metallica]
MLKLIVQELLLGALILYIGTGVLVALRSGVANAGGKRVARRDRPCAFGLIVLVQIGFVTLFCWIALTLK